MSDLKVEIHFNTTFTAKEFSVMTRALAGHILKPDDITLARNLNKRLLDMRVAQLSQYAKQSQQALEMALSELQAQRVECETCGCEPGEIMGSCGCTCHD